MTEIQRAPRKAIDALHAELLGVLVDIETKATQVRTDLPAARQHVDELVGTARKGFEELRSWSVALVGYVKNKQLETLGEIEAAHSKVTDDTRRVLGGFERVIWTSCALTGVNTLLLLGLVFFSR